MDNKKRQHISKIILLYITTILLCIALSDNAQSNTDPNMGTVDTNLILLEEQYLEVSREFLKQIGLYNNSMKTSDAWSKYSIDKSSDPNVFIIDQSKADLIQKTLENQENFIFQGIGHPETLITFKGHSMDYLVYVGQLLIATDIELTPSLDANNNIKLDMHIHITDTVFPKIEFRLNNVIKQKGKRFKTKENIIFNSKIFTVFEKSINTLIPDGHTLLILGPEVTHNISKAASRPLIDLPFVDNLIKVTSRYTFQTIPLTLLKFKILTLEEAEKLSKESQIPIYPRQ